MYRQILVFIVIVVGDNSTNTTPPTNTCASFLSRGVTNDPYDVDDDNFMRINIPSNPREQTYPSSMHCFWRVTAPQGKYTWVLIKYIDLETVQNRLSRQELSYYGQFCP